MGAVNGALVATIGIPSFLVTLGMLGIARGSAMWMTEVAPVPVLNSTFNSIFGSGQVGPFPSLFLWLVIMLVGGTIILRKTAYGRQVLATGGNESTARLSGVNTPRIKFYVLLVSGIVAALAGMLYAGRLHSGRFQWGRARAVGDCSCDTGWYELVRRPRHGHRIGPWRAVGRPHQ